MNNTALKDRARAANLETLTDGLLDDPDCLAEMEYTYSVFRFRYSWGTVYEVTWSNLADAFDRMACMALVPADQFVYVETVNTDTLGLGHNGVLHEITHRLAVAN